MSRDSASRATNSEGIGKGDLVMCITACCETRKLGTLGKVREVGKVAPHATQCQYCGHIDRGIHVFAAGRKANNSAPIWWVRKITPPAQMDDVEHREEITA